MNMSIRRFFLSIPGLSNVYRMSRKAYHSRRFRKSAKKFFTNEKAFWEAITLEDGKTVDLFMKNGLIVTVRRNHADASILSEVFLDNCYVRDIHLRPHPVVVDIGGFIGDFALFAVKCLDARRVVICEPSPKNLSLLKRNVANNHLEDRIEVVEKAVTDGKDVLMNVDAPDRKQAMVSAYGNPIQERKPVPGITLAALAEEHHLEDIDLLKIDCEGGEYDILSTVSASLFLHIENIVFECHEIEQYQARLKAVKERLKDNGYSVSCHGMLFFASRSVENGFARPKMPGI